MCLACRTGSRREKSLFLINAIEERGYVELIGDDRLALCGIYFQHIAVPVRMAVSAQCIEFVLRADYVDVVGLHLSGVGELCIGVL